MNERVLIMIKQSLKFAIWPSLGVMVGGVIIPRFTRPQLYNETYPTIFIQVAIYLGVGYIVCFLTYLFCEWIKVKVRKKQ